MAKNPEMSLPSKTQVIAICVINITRIETVSFTCAASQGGGFQVQWASNVTRKHDYSLIMCRI